MKTTRCVRGARLWAVLCAGLLLYGCPDDGGGSGGNEELDSGAQGEDAGGGQLDSESQGEDGSEPDVGRDPDASDPDVGRTPDARGDAEAPLDSEPPADAAPDEGVSPDGSIFECEPGAEEFCPDPTCIEGVRTCVEGFWSACVGPAEACNGADDDCDGNTDEDFPGLEGACDVGVGACVAMGVSVCTAAGDALECRGQPGNPQPEVCDGVDNDCNGLVDEGNDGDALGEPCYSGPAGTRNVGVCREGAASCGANGAGACLGEALPGVESCNGLDDDCDGRTDEAAGGGTIEVACYGGPDGTLGRGLCQGGIQVCEAGVLGPCRGEVRPGAELCDTLDNDCNGTDDDVAAGSCLCEPGAERACYGGPDATAGIGACRRGVQVCAPDGLTFLPCQNQVLPSAELCDGADNDCNGRADDAIVGVGEACAAGVGSCSAAGATVCDSETGAVSCDAVPAAPVGERCDTLDNDCDGTVDENINLGNPCAAGVGACRREGVRVCGRGGNTVCGARAGMATPEICNAIDDDCNGQVDDGLRLGEACSVGVGGCAATGVFVCGAEGAVTCSVAAGAPQAETCNGLDDNCDGTTDEGNPGGGVACNTESPGECRRGLLTCGRGELTCVQATQPAAEVCDGLDNDCNGRPDDGPNGQVIAASCYDGPAGTADVGICRGGQRTCAGGDFGPCERQVLPGVEVCDSRDNDCNGRVDDLPDGQRCACEPGSTRACYGGPMGTQDVGICRGGQQTCNANGLSYGACVGEQLPQAEVCDNTDNDCDGRLDDEIQGTGAACSAGVGQCLANGQTVCDGVAGRIVCNARPGQPAAESCDTRDNDCDAATDEGLGVGNNCSAGVGTCRANGQNVCGPNGTVVCSARAGQPGVEICDALDNDCDGSVDDGLGLGQACNVGVGACARAGFRVCGPNGTVVCSAQPGQPGVEACDNADNDCDGRSDEGNPGGGQQCQTGSSGDCAAGTRLCQAGQFVCQQTAQATPEVCDGRDNNCNGSTDETAAGAPLSQACYSGPGGTQNVGVCRGGNQTCANGRFGNCAGEVVPGNEVCDGLDNNCNNRVDDVAGAACACLPGERRACYTGAANTRNIGLCRDGNQVCNAQGTAYGACDGQVLPAAEVCDTRDNDCNNVVDDAPNVGLQCNVGVGQCQRAGRFVCGGNGAVVCNVQPGQPAAEVCDNLDNNCNGSVDDVPGLGDRCTAGVGVCLAGGNQICNVQTRALECNAVPGQPGREVCNGLDDDCNRTVDNDVGGTGAVCQAGVGECLREGQTICGGASGIVCSAQAGAPAAELCDGRDNDCDATSDENPTDAGQPCTVGVGACEAGGQTQCLRGRLRCGGVPNPPQVEVCNQFDDDCDGRSDEALDCNIYRSCLDAYARGVRANGVYRIGNADRAFNVYCDQTTDQGGWTLVGSSAGETLDDQASNWYADLLTLAPARANGGIWDGLRNLGDRFDVRFACRDALGAADAPMTVDLSMYRQPWYSEWTSGADAQSCFMEGDGQGQDLPPAARRNNLTGQTIVQGVQWNTGLAEGEDACQDTTDFTLDFTDRGMDGNQSDGTDWGEDDGARKCGRDGLATGQWFVFARERRRIGVLGPRGLTAPLVAAGFPAEDVAFGVDATNRLNFRNYEAIFLGRYADNWPLMDGRTAAFLDQFNRDGGSVVTEWDGLAILGQGYTQSYIYRNGAANPLGWFRYFTGGGGLIASNTPITPLVPTDPIFSGVGNPFRGNGATEYFHYVGNREVGEDTYLLPLATFPGTGVGAFPRGPLTGVARGRRCAGNVLIATSDYQDGPNEAGLGPFLRNLASEALLPAPAAPADTCNLATRPILMVCGVTGRNVQEFIRGFTGLQVVNACRPDARTQALLITRDAGGQVDAATLQGYLQGGGIVVTEYSAGDEVYNLAFGGRVVQSANRVGACEDNVQPLQQFSPLDRFWDDNRFEPVAAGATGCGFDISAFPGVVPLGGAGNGAVTLGYRDLGAGRLWLVESDWQDGGANFTAQSRGLMHYMITHNRQTGFTFIIL